MAVYFLSDVHLGLGPPAEEKAKEDNLLAFLESIRPDTEALYILGDLFDFWFEYKTVIPKGFHRTLAALQSFTDRGIPVHFLVGNHDFWMGDFFTHELGIIVHRQPFETTIGTHRIYLHHGDGLSARDLGYRILKPILRNRLSMVLYRWLHPDLGVRLARGSSRASRDHTSTKDFGEDAGMIAHAREKIEQGATIVVMGHRHKPKQVSVGSGTFVNLGDWISHNTYGELANGAFALKSWKNTNG
jgi:UDP-2,3-diacylglucosamine hydrolase